MYRSSTLAVVFTCTILSSAQAARLTEVEGKVLVNKGEGFLEVNGATAVSAGDRVLVRGKGAAKIDYGNGCVKKLSANQTAVISSKPVCDAAPAVAQKQPAAPKVTASLKDAPGAPVVVADMPDHYAALIGGVLAVATGAVALASDDNDRSERGREEPRDPGPDTGEVPTPVDLAPLLANGVAVPLNADSNDKPAAASPVRQAAPSTPTMVSTAASAAAAVPLPAEPAKPIVVVNNMVIAETKAAEAALDGGDTTEGLPASP